MHARIKMVAVAATFGAVTVFPVAGAQAATAHCDATKYPSKVELDNAGPSTYTGLPAGTEVCIKAGTGTTIVTVDEDGYITNTELTNANGNAKGISYYAYGTTTTGGGS